MPSARGMTAARAERNSHKHRRLFTGALGALRDGERVQYTTSKGETLLAGTVRLGEGPAGGAGILCDCCAEVSLAAQVPRSQVPLCSTPAGCSILCAWALAAELLCRLAID